MRVVSPGVQLRVRFPVDDIELSELHGLAFDSPGATCQPWAARLARHSLTWVGAFSDTAGEELVGFVHLAWDGGSHAFVLDTAVHPAHQGHSIGRDLVRAAAAEARQAGCTWLHVDYEPQLSRFYRDVCGFQHTEAGLLDLSR